MNKEMWIKDVRHALTQHQFFWLEERRASATFGIILFWFPLATVVDSTRYLRYQLSPGSKCAVPILDASWKLIGLTELSLGLWHLWHRYHILCTLTTNCNRSVFIHLDFEKWQPAKPQHGQLKECRRLSVWFQMKGGLQNGIHYDACIIFFFSHNVKKRENNHWICAFNLIHNKEQGNSESGVVWGGWLGNTLSLWRLGFKFRLWPRVKSDLILIDIT